MTVDLCLVNPNGGTPTSPFAAVEPPLWLGLIAGYRLAQGQRVAIVDAEAEGLTVWQTICRVKALCPQEIGIVVMGHNPSVSSTPKMPVAEELLKYLTAWLTGLHPVAVCHPLALKHPFVGIPSIPWELLHMERYRAHNWHCLDGSLRSPYASVYTSLGCPFACYYCNVHALYGSGKVKFRPLDDIMEEVRTLVTEYQVRNIKIWDELFTANEERVIAICSALKRYDLNMWAYARLDTVNPRMLRVMKGAGINWLAYGFEGIKDPKFIDRVETVIRMTREAGINIIGNFLFGLPGDTKEDMQAALDMAMRENLEYANFNVALPYPGSAWYDSLSVKPQDWDAFNQFSLNICASAEVVKFRDAAFQTYFSRPEYLSMVRGKFGEQAERHIQEMLAWKIRQ